MVVDGLALLGLVMVLAVIAPVLGKLLNPQAPDRIEDARPGSMLIHSVEDGQTYIELRTCDETDEYYLQELASDWLSGPTTNVRVEFKTSEGAVLRYTREKLVELGWLLG